MHRRRQGGSSPILTFILVWILLNMLGIPIGKVAGFLIATGLAIAAAVAVAVAVRRRGKKKKAQADAAEKETVAAAPGEMKAEAHAPKPSPYSPEVQAVIDEGRVAQKEMGRLYRSIDDPKIRKKINELMAVSDKIVRDAIDDPSDVPQIRKFLDYYLPTTIKLLNAYDRMSAQEVEGENISGSMERIEDMLDTAIAAYKKQLDALFANQAADIQMDIDTMNGMLAREGLGGKSYLDWKDFMRQYEEQQKKEKESKTDDNQLLQKGSASNG